MLLCIHILMYKIFVADDKFADVIAILERRGWDRSLYAKSPNFLLKWRNLSNINFRLLRSDQVAFDHAHVLETHQVRCLSIVGWGKKYEGNSRRLATEKLRYRLNNFLKDRGSDFQKKDNYISMDKKSRKTPSAPDTWHRSQGLCRRRSRCP